MKPDQRVLSRPGFQAFLLGLGLVLLHWPFLIWPQSWRQPHAYLYLILVWALLVLLMYFVSRSLGPRLPSAREGEDQEGPEGQET